MLLLDRCTLHAHPGGLHTEGPTEACSSLLLASNSAARPALCLGSRPLQPPSRHRSTSTASSARHRSTSTVLCVSFPAARAAPLASGSAPAAPLRRRACRPPGSASAAAAQSPRLPAAPAARPPPAAQNFPFLTLHSISHSRPFRIISHASFSKRRCASGLMHQRALKVRKQPKSDHHLSTCH